jgi:hypothetical protein
MVAARELADARAYRVETHDGRIGSVAAVLPRAARDGSGVLLVNQSPLSCRLVAVPFDAVEFIDRERQRLLLREGTPDDVRRRVISHV